MEAATATGRAAAAGDGPTLREFGAWERSGGGRGGRTPQRQPPPPPPAPPPPPRPVGHPCHTPLPADGGGGGGELPHCGLAAANGAYKRRGASSAAAPAEERCGFGWGEGAAEGFGHGMLLLMRRASWARSQYCGVWDGDGVAAWCFLG